MAALFAFHDWLPPSISDIRFLLYRLFLHSHATQVQVRIKQTTHGARTLHSIDAIKNVGLDESCFSISAYTTSESKKSINIVSPRISGQIQFTSNGHFFSFFSYDMDINSLSAALKMERIFNEFISGYGFLCDAKNILMPDYYVAGIDVLTPDKLSNSVSSFLSSKTPVGLWGKIMQTNEKPYFQGKFRDIYPQNIVDYKHLDALKKLGVLDDVALGITVDELNADLFLLKVPEARLRNIRPLLAEKDLLLAPESY